MGDKAELRFEAYCKEQQWPFERFGWNRPSTGTYHMTRMLRFMPDFYANAKLWEVMGMGRDGILKSMKLEKWEAMKAWNKVQPLAFYVWNSSEKRGVVIGWHRMVQLVARARRRGVLQFHDGPEYYPIPWEDIE